MILRAIFAALFSTAIATGPAGAALSPNEDLGARSGRLPASIVVVLPHRNQSVLDALVTAIAQGRAKPISHSEFVARFAPDPASVARAAAFLQAAGFSIQRRTEGMVFAAAPTEIVERTFGVAIHNMRSNGRVDAYAATAPGRIPAAIADTVSLVIVDARPVAWVK